MSGLGHQVVAAWIFDEHGRVLLIRENYDRRRYGPPGGKVEPGESPREAVVREVRKRPAPDSSRRDWSAFVSFGNCPAAASSGPAR